MSLAVLDCPPGIFEHLGSNAVSEEAEQVNDLFAQVRERLSASYSLGQWRKECRNRLCKAWLEASKSNWDGYEALPVSLASLMAASEFIDALPKNIPLPEISVDPDGEISFDWYGGHRRQVSISVGKGGVLSYAALFGSDHVRGKERLQGSLPFNLIEYVRRAT
jgi:hypothetical protein